MDEDEEMAEQQTQHGTAALKYGEATLATADARAAGVAAGNIQVLGNEAETLQLPEVIFLLPRSITTPSPSLLGLHPVSPPSSLE